MHTLSFSRSYFGRSLLLALLLLWPLLLTGKPTYMLDSAYYQNGGATALSFVMRKIHPEPPTPPRASANAAGKETGDSKVVARSIVYSVLAYLFSWPGVSMIGLVMIQALCVAFAVTALFMAIAGTSLAAFAAMATVMTFGSGLAPVVNFMVPDCFAGVMLATLAILPFYWRRFSPLLLALIIALAALSATVHASHPPVALGTALVATIVLMLMRRRTEGARRADTAILWLPAVAGVALTMLTGLIGFGQASIAPKGFPLALARGLDNGPARWYLNDACAKEPRRYAMCEIYGARMPLTVDEFLFAPGNVVNRATPAQLDRVRAEEPEILIQTTRRYPLQQAYITLRDVPTQFITFDLSSYVNYAGSIVQLKTGKLTMVTASDATPPFFIRLLDWLAHAMVIASVAVLAWRWRRLSFAQRGVVLIVLGGLLANAAVCAIFSGVAPRYQARVIWLLPLIAVAFARRWSDNEDEPGASRVH